MRIHKNPSYEMWAPDRRSVARFYSNDGTRWDVAIYGDKGEQRLQSKRGVTLATAQKWASKILRERAHRRNPLPVGKTVTVRARRLRNGRVEIYGA
jgi:hypothetical protein